MLTLAVAAFPAAAAATTCNLTTIGVDTTAARGSAAIIFEGIGQTFLASDSLMRSLTVWRIASQDSHAIGMYPYIVEVDSTGVPDPNKILYVGPTQVILYGDGIHPIEFRWDLDPPLMLPHRGTYAFFVFQDRGGGG